MNLNKKLKSLYLIKIINGYKTLWVLFLFTQITQIYSQELERVNIAGTIIVNSLDLEGVTVYNAISNTGTVTDKKGQFVIGAALNDKLIISALQFQNFEITINQDIMDSQTLIAVLVEEVNKLPEVVILPYGLTGNVSTDIARIKTVNPNLDVLYFGLDNLDKFNFTDDYLSGVRNVAIPDNRMYFTADALKIIDLLSQSFLNPVNKNKASEWASDRDILEKYSMKYLVEMLSISEKNIIEFIYFVEDYGLKRSLLKDEQELQFINFLVKRREEFQANKNDKN
ncbi:carboxypeptidase-like regulatory domain-containing protein [Flavobacteriaceae bacterium]|nr:carboxypeptidase-like regulatory domain-containing protein [Flavobacteriaceae bacterium]